MLKKKIYAFWFGCSLLIQAQANLASKTDLHSRIQNMSWEEKIGQMFLVYNSPLNFLEKYHIGGVLIMSNMMKDPEKLQKEIKEAQSKLSIPLIVSMDQEGGKVNRLVSLPQFKNLPSATDIQSWPSDSISQLSEKIGFELKKMGINLNLAPVVDPSHNWEGKETFMHAEKRSFGPKANQIVGPALAFVKGYQKSGIWCISKHFPGYDVMDNSDHHIAISHADSLHVAENIEAFRQTISPMAGVMLSSIFYKKFCERPSVFSQKMVGLARDIAGDKVLMTDDLWGAALRGYVSGVDKVHPVKYSDADFEKLFEMAFWAGNDIFMITFPKKVEIMQKCLLRLVNENPDARARIDSSVRRILILKEKMGLL